MPENENIGWSIAGSLLAFFLDPKKVSLVADLFSFFILSSSGYASLAIIYAITWIPKFILEVFVL